MKNLLIARRAERIEEETMRSPNKERPRLAVVFLLLMLSATCSFSLGKEKDKDKEGTVTFYGAIEDSQCAYNVHSDSHSHDWMIDKKVEGAKDAKSCTLHCVRDLGGNFVLVVKNEIYRLADQDLPAKFAGEKVKITGILDAKTQTIRQFTIEQSK